MASAIGRALEAAPHGKPEPGTLRAGFIDSGGIQRRFVVYVPVRSAPTRRLPLVLNLHGSTSFPEEQLALSNAIDAADRHDVIVLAPEGLDRAWNVPASSHGPDDVGFIRETIAAIAEALPVDRTRVYAMGFSGGGRMACQLGAELADHLAAIGAVSGVRFPEGRRPNGPLPVLAIHGVEDPVNPYAGGGPSYWQYGVEAAIHGWTAHNRSGAVRREHLSPAVTKVTYGSGATEVVSYRVEGLGHQWPGSHVDIGADFGPAASEPNATEVALAFFAKHRRNRRTSPASRSVS